MTKLRWTIIGLVVLVIFLKLIDHTLDNPKYGDIEAVLFSTSDHQYLIPGEYVVLGSHFEAPPAEITDGLGANIDLIFSQEYLAENGVLISSIQDPVLKSFTDGIYITLTNPNDTALVNLLNSRLAIIDKPLKSDQIEFDADLNVFRVNIDSSEERSWDLFRAESALQIESDIEIEAQRVARCYEYSNKEAKTCLYEFEIDDLYVFLSSSEEDYRVIDALKTFLANRLDQWEADDLTGLRRN